MIKILVDSSSELTKKEAEEKGFLFVPISVNIGEGNIGTAWI